MALLTNDVIKNRSRGAVGSATLSHGEGRWFEPSCEHLGRLDLSGSASGMWFTGGAGTLLRGGQTLTGVSPKAGVDIVCEPAG